MDTLDPFQPAFWIRVGMALLCGSMVGLERQLRGKAMGIRTAILICMGTSVFIQLGNALVVGSQGDSSRVLGQIVTGIGFLGAGAIMTQDGAVHGLTSAATIWVLASIGAAIGLGHELLAFLLALLVVGVLVGVERLERAVRALRRGYHGRSENEGPGE